MGSPYTGGREIREQALATGVPCIVLPQSFMGPEDVSRYERVYVRERYSLQYCTGGILAPDLALGWEFERPNTSPVCDCEWFLRIDSESLFPDFPPHDPVRYAETPRQYLRAAARVAYVFTDRLHFAIAGLMAGRRVTLLPCSHHKNRGMWEAWLSDLGAEWAESPG